MTTMMTNVRSLFTFEDTITRGHKLSVRTRQVKLLHVLCGGNIKDNVTLTSEKISLRAGWISTVD